MNFSFTSLLSIIIITLFSAAASENVEKVSRSFNFDDATAFKMLIQCEASPDELLSFIGHDAVLDCDYAVCWHIMESLKYAINSNQVDTIRTLLPHIQFTYDGHGNAIKKLLNMALSAHSPDICDLLMSQGFEPDFKWRANFWNVQSNRWVVGELGSLAELHSAYAVALSADQEAVEWCYDGRVGLMMVEYNNFLAQYSPAFTSLKASQPSALLRGLMQNLRLKDEDMVLIVRRLLELGAETDPDSVNAFLITHPGHILVHEALRLFLWKPIGKQAHNPKEQLYEQTRSYEDQHEEQISDPEVSNPDEMSEEQASDRVEQPAEDAGNPEEPQSQNRGGVMAWLYSWF